MTCENIDDFAAFVRKPEEYDVVAVRMAAQIRPQIGPRTTHQVRRGRDVSAFVTKLTRKFFRDGTTPAAVCDVFGNGIEIVPGRGGEI